MEKYQKALKERADAGCKSAEDILIHSYVESLIEPVLPMLAMRVKTIMEEVFEQTKKKYKQAGQAKLARYEEALRFYATQDNGETARKALGVEG